MAEDTRLIDGFCVGGYRSFREPQFIGPLSKLNVFAGPNNSGKSNVLRFAAKHLPAVKRNPLSAEGFEDIDLPLNALRAYTCGLALSKRNAKFAETLKKSGGGSSTSLLERLFRCPCLIQSNSEQDELIWFVYTADNATLNRTLAIDSASVLRETGQDQDPWYSLWQRFRPGMSGGGASIWIKESLEFISPCDKSTLSTRLVPAIREIVQEKKPAEDHSGAGLIRTLAFLQRPDHGKESDKEVFATIERFLRQITDNESASLEIPTSQKCILVKIDGRSLLGNLRSRSGKLCTTRHFPRGG